MDLYNNQYNLISNILLSINSIIINNVLQPYNILKVLIKYDIDKVCNLFKVFLDKNVDINNNEINILNNIITIKFNEDKEYYIYCFNYSLTKYIYTINEGLFDCNLMFTSYNNYYFAYNQFYIKHDDIYYRRLNKKFSYLINNFQGIENIMSRNKEVSTLLKTHYFNKLNYAFKLILNGWIMDEFYLKDKSWTINYWDNYVKYLSIIKFKNKLEVNTDKKCQLCKEKLHKTDIVFSINNLYAHYNCIINKLYN